jgi:hypothetical protein
VLFGFVRSWLIAVSPIFVGGRSPCVDQRTALLVVGGTPG